LFNRNLVFLEKFFKREVLSRVDLDDLEKTGISQLKVRYSSRDFEDKLQSGNFESEFRINPKKLKYLGSEYKLYTYIVLRLIKIYTQSSYYTLILEDYEEYLNKRTFSNNERYFYLTHINDNMFCYEMDSTLSRQESCRNCYRLINSKIPQRDNKRLIDIILEIVTSANLVLISKARPKRLQRHKGYRDHGSLGSEFSKTQKDQSRDWSLQLEEQKREKDQQDFLELLLGLGGWK
jgi:hypothetical protein